MENYLTYQIILGSLTYKNVMAKYPAYKDAIDATLKSMNWKIDTTGNCIPDTDL